MKSFYYAISGLVLCSIQDALIGMVTRKNLLTIQHLLYDKAAEEFTKSAAGIAYSYVCFTGTENCAEEKSFSI
jgi:hypothetical protein